MFEEIPGIGDGGGTAVADAPPEATPEIEPTAETTESVPQETPESAAPQAAEGEQTPKTDDLSDIETDGRRIDAKTRAQIAELKKTNPRAAKAWAESYFRNQAVLKEFPEAKSVSDVVREVRAMRATLDEAGGEEGIAELRGEVSDYRKEIQQFADGDKELIEQLAENPAALARATRNSLEVLQTKNADAYDEALLPHFVSRLEKAGVHRAVDDMLALVKEGKGPETYKLLLGMKEWLGQLGTRNSALAEKAKNGKDPRETEFDRKQAEFEKEKSQHYQKTVETDVNRWNNPEIDKLVEPFAKQLKLPSKGKNNFRNTLIARVWEVLANDNAYIKGVRAIRAKGDAVKTAEFIHKAFVERLPEQFRLHRNENYPNFTPAPAAKPGTNGKGAPAVTAVKIAQGQRPRREDVDWTKTSDTMWITGRAYLKDGKLVTGFKDAPPNKF